MKKLHHLLILIVSLLTTTITHAQGPKSSGFDNLMRSSGRIYVVVAVMLTILVGLIIYLVRLDNKIKRLEKNS